MSKKILKNNSGFTLAELMVSVAVIVIVSAMTLVNFRSTNNNAVSSMAAQKLASDIRKVQGWALGLKDFGANSSDKSWGIYFQKDFTYYSFYIDTGNYLCQSSCDGASTEKVGDNIKILNDVKIIKIMVDGGNSNKGQLSFSPPEPIVNICGINTGSCGADKLEIELDGGSKVIINKYGMVDVD